MGCKESTLASTPTWLTDEAIERTEALGRELAEFLLRRRDQKEIDADAQVDIGPRLREMLARLEAGREAGKA